MSRKGKEENTQLISPCVNLSLEDQLQNLIPLRGKIFHPPNSSLITAFLSARQRFMRR